MKQKLLALLLAGMVLLASGCGGNTPNSSASNNSGSAADGGVENDQSENSGSTNTTPENPAPAEPEPDPRQEAIDGLLGDMTLAEKVGQMFFVRCPDVSQAEKVSEYHLGGYLLFGRDFEDSAGEWLTAEAFTDTIASYQAAAEIPLLIGVDAEGGTVARATRNPNLFAAKRKSPQAVYDQGGLEAIREDTRTINEGLLSYGINVNFAPVADVSTNSADFIYDRTLGQDAAATAEYVAAAVEEMGAVGIGSVLKHFPGYGSNSDTHTGVAVDSRPYDQFLSQDFLPFQAGIDAGAGCVLVNHNVVESMDGTLPASLSPEVHRILRQELGFTGVTLTDDLAMDAVEAYAEDGSVAVLAVLAGNDMIITTDFEEQIPLGIAAVESGAIDEAVIDQAVSRVLGWKYDLGLLG